MVALLWPARGFAVGRTCPTCNRPMPGGVAFCPFDGTELPGLAEAHPKNRCPQCGRLFPAAAQFCSFEGARLVAANKPGPPPDGPPTAVSGVSGAAERPLLSLDGPAAAGAGEMPRSDPPPAAPVPDAAPSQQPVAATTRLARDAVQPAPHPRLDLREEPAEHPGADYVEALRKALECLPEEKAAAGERVRRAQRRFEARERVAVRVQFPAVDNPADDLPHQAETYLSHRLARNPLAHITWLDAGAPDPPGQQVVLRGTVVRRQFGPRVLQVAVRLMAIERASGRELWVEAVQAHPRQQLPAPAPPPKPRRRFLGLGRAAPPASQPPPAPPPDHSFEDALERLAERVAARLSGWTAHHRDEGRRLERAGQFEAALEEDLLYLFETPDFDSSDAEAANALVMRMLRFSPLDWLWGEPIRAVLIPDGRAQRRLPLGFRSADPDDQAGPELPPVIRCLQDGMEMVLVPGGLFLMGAPSGPEEEQPEHPVNLATYYIDCSEVMNLQYRAFMHETGHQPPTLPPGQAQVWSGADCPATAADLPVVGVSWDDAAGYCHWARKRLPTEAQWEKAARGTFGPDYPRSADPALTQHANCGKTWKGAETLVSVSANSETPNPFGCLNMLGNAAEWCRDRYAPDAYRRGPANEPSGPDSGPLRVVRGGSWETPPAELRATARSGLSPATRSASVGFRGVLVLPGQRPPGLIAGRVGKVRAE